MNYSPDRYDPGQKALMASMRVVVLSPIMYPEAKFWKSLVDMMAFSWHQGLCIDEMGITEKMVVDWARNNLAEAALEKKSPYTGLPYTHFLWVDSDHVFNPDMACELAQWFQNPEVDAVGALYYGRTDKPLPRAFVKDKTKDKYKHYPIIEVPPNLCEVDAVGFGGLLIKREVFEGTPKPWFTVDYRAGEDIAFCVHAKESGFRFFLDGRYKMGHIGEPPIIAEETYRQYLADNADEYRDRVRVSLGGQDGI